MATRTSLLSLLNGIPTMVDLTADELVVLSITLGGSGGTNLTKTQLDTLIANSHASGSDNQSIVAGAGLTGGGSGATVTLDVGAGDGISVGADSVAVDGTVIRSSGAVPFAADQSMGNHKLTDLQDPTADQEAATKKYVDDAITAATPSAADVTYSNTTSGLTATNVQDAIDEVEGRLDTVEASYIPSTEKGAAGGVATLDGGGKVPVSQLPNSVMEFKGAWDASTNSPTLADGTGNAGDVYRVSVAGSQDLGSGSQSFGVGDWVMYNGSIWQHSPATDAVTSVFSRTGAVTAQSGDYTAAQITNTPAGGIAATTVQGAINELDTEKFNSADFSTSFDSAFAAKSTTDLAEGSNQYFTAERAQDAVGGILTDTDSVDFTYDDAGNQITAAVLRSPLVRKSMVAGESMAANTSFLVRMAVSGETAGRVYKADSSSALTDGKFYAIGIATTSGAVSAGQAVMVTMMGSQAQGSSDTPFSSGDVGKPVYLTTAGAMSITAPTSSGTAVWRIGMVETTTSVLVMGQQLNGVN